MKAKNFLLAISAAAIALGSFGCATDARRIDAGGNETITSLDKINVADFDIAAGKMLESMLSSGVFDEFPKKPVIMMVGRIKNKTSDTLNISMLTSRITSRLNRSKIVRVAAQDAASRELALHNEMLGGKGAPLPQIVLTGEILEDTANAGRTKEITYTFILKLNFDGVSAWEDQIPITKQGTRAAVGW